MARLGFVHLIAIAAAVLCASDRTSGAETGNLEQLQERALQLVNSEREKRGLRRLSAGSALNNAAQAHAEDMLRRAYYAHTSPEGNTVADRYTDAGGSRWQLTAENIARCQGCPSPPTEERVETLHQGWMNSPPHRDNILRRGLDRLGFGIVVGADQTLYAVQTFAGPGTPRLLQTGEEASKIPPGELTAVALQQINDERRKQGVQPLRADDGLVQVASNLIPEDDMASSDLDLQDALATASASVGGSRWQSLAAISGRCGGCGTVPSVEDVRFFAQRWLGDPNYRSRLLGKSLTHFGLALKADGTGLKIAAALLGQDR